ncbi:unnamed protein product [Rangifer tarandus platyrhynchus]|uniref:Uncharacterized protein n=1 Tax=Rangifer tarandus platyrhynchus TaxID=3082113 RepID=A0AC59Z5J3_RANTA
MSNPSSAADLLDMFVKPGSGPPVDRSQANLPEAQGHLYRPGLSVAPLYPQSEASSSSSPGPSKPASVGPPLALHLHGVA